jgi:hypothetical protein
MMAPVTITTVYEEMPRARLGLLFWASFAALEDDREPWWSLSA